MTEAKPRKRSAAAKATRLELPPRLEISSLAPLHGKMTTLLKGKSKLIVLDGAEVSVVDSAGLQLLVAFVSTVKGQGFSLSWDNYSVQVYQMASEMGLADRLGD